MDDLISRQAVNKIINDLLENDNLQASPSVWYWLHTIMQLPSDLVRCGECKYRKVNEHYGEKGYMKLKAICTLDTGDPFGLGRNAEDENWFCADGKRREDDAEIH